MSQPHQTILGYSGLELFEECYGYNENACYIADSPAAAGRFMEYSGCGAEYRIDPLTLSQIMQDFGSSCGEFAMETAAFAKFRAAAQQAGIRFESEAVDGSPELTLVHVEGVEIQPD